MVLEGLPERDGPWIRPEVRYEGTKDFRRWFWAGPCNELKILPQ